MKQIIRCADCEELAERMVLINPFGWIPFCKKCARKHGGSHKIIDYYIRALKVIEYKEERK